MHDRLEPFTGLAHRIVQALAKLLFDLSQFTPHALADRQSLTRKKAKKKRTLVKSPVLAICAQTSPHQRHVPIFRM
jgi:hypothetical protein